MAKRNIVQGPYIVETVRDAMCSVLGVYFPSNVTVLPTGRTFESSFLLDYKRNFSLPSFQFMLMGSGYQLLNKTSNKIILWGSNYGEFVGKNHLLLVKLQFSVSLLHITI